MIRRTRASEKGRSRVLASRVMGEAWARTWAVAGFVGPLAFWLAAIVGATQVEGYSHRTQFVSELAAEGSDARLIMTVGFLVYGVSLAVLALCVRRLWPALLALAVVTGISAVGTLAAGVGSCDAGCPTEGSFSASQWVHNAASPPTFLAWLTATVMAAWLFRGTRYGQVATVLGAVQVIALGVLGSMMDANDRAADGLFQRIDLVAAGLWSMATAVALRAGVARSGSAPSRR